MDPAEGAHCQESCSPPNTQGLRQSWLPAGGRDTQRHLSLPHPRPEASLPPLTWEPPGCSSHLWRRLDEDPAGNRLCSSLRPGAYKEASSRQVGARGLTLRSRTPTPCLWRAHPAGCPVNLPMCAGRQRLCAQ